MPVDSPDPLTKGAVILCGGKSARMQADKASLPFGAESMLARVVRVVSEVVPVERVVLVASPAQHLPVVDEGLQVVRDQLPYQGPLAALGVGLSALPDSVENVLVTGCDVPFLSTEVIAFLFSEIQGFDAAVPGDDERLYPLVAVYRTSLGGNIAKQLSRPDCSLHALLKQIRLRRISLESLREIDPELVSLVNVNSPADYAAALARAGLS